MNFANVCQRVSDFKVAVAYENAVYKKANVPVF